ncbi:hypothetical protein R9C00_24370 [Flammeovirgaceae bacterium SG7u.111]|nr:hypothetical protein [Flammeovirgaceae bacterium SG7u.132]WPO34838.1 hypothetical protein R9C00_24370 [Flammeovirgaceae bacterium SG7u.111]
MKSIKFLISAICLFFMFQVQAQSVEKLKDKTPEERAKIQTEKMVEKLAIEGDLEMQVYAINLKYAEAIEPLKDSEDSKVSKFQKLKSLSEDKNAEMEKVLTEDQFMAYLKMQEDMTKELKQNFRARRSSN